jgi:hypothetical protein
MQRPVPAIEIDTVKITVLRDPSSNFEHVLVFDKKVYSCASARTGDRAISASFAGRVLVNLRCDVAFD